MLSLIFFIGLCWGSFLNVIGYRLIHQDSILFPIRSYCPLCQHTLEWTDIIPVFSWIFLKGKCHYCKKPISYLYPFIEIITGIVAVLLYYYIDNTAYFIFTSIFCSALIIITRTDLETMLISQWTTLFLVPIPLITTLFIPLPLSFFESVIGAFSAYTFLYGISWIYKKYKHIEGVGEGDIEMLCMIGSFLGPIGWWLTLVISSFIGTFAILFFAAGSKLNIQNVKIPFGPFLALGALITLFCKQWLRSLFILLY